MNERAAASPLDALDPRASASVAASAGSGKTWLLVSRIVRLLLAGAEPGGIVAVTFTRKAAAEMRLRLTERLRLLASGDDAAVAAELVKLGVAADAPILERARSLYRAQLFAPFPVRAMTLHAFCQDLLNRFALEAGVSPGFALAEAEADLLDRAWRRLQAQLAHDPDSAAGRALRELIALGDGGYALQQRVSAFLQRRGDWWAYVEGQDDPVAWASAQLRDTLGPCDAEAALATLEAPAFRERLAALCERLAQWGDVRSVKAGRIGPALAASGRERLDALERALLNGNGQPYAFQPSKKLRAEQRETLLALHGDVLAALLAAREQCLRARTLQRGAASFALGQAALQALADELARDHALGFIELEWHAGRLLRRDGAAEWVRYKVDRRIDHLLIDEFQDTSPTQWRMLLPLLEEMAAGDAGRARSLFIVGDAKQSIYGFRRADPRLLHRASGWMRTALDAIDAPLHDSRRSAPAVIDFVNALFAPEELRAALAFEPHGTHRHGDWGRVEVAPPIGADEAEDAATTAFRDPLRQPRVSPEDRRAEREAAQVAARIGALVASGVPVRGEHGAFRPIGYGDVMVLARNRTWLHRLERKFAETGIPFIGAARGTLLGTSEARDLEALLRLLDAPHRDLELAQVLRSPLFGVDDAALGALAQDARAHGGGWLDALARLAPARPDLARPDALIRQWRPLAARLPAHDLLDRVLRDADAAARYEAALPRVTAARARANLGAFLQLALEADSGRYPTLRRFLRYLESQRRAWMDAPDEAPPADVGERVRVMTVHAAKGLEAPAVFIVNTGRVATLHTPRLLVDWPEDRERPRAFLVAGGRGERDQVTQALGAAHKEREAREEFNLLYVAATRARQFLHISGFRQSNAGERLSWHDHALRALQGLPPAAPLPGAAPGTLAYATGTPQATPAPAAAPVAPAADPRLRRAIELPDAAAAPSERAAREPSGGAEAALRGSAIHLLLQEITAGRDDPEGLWRRLRARLSPAPARAPFDAWLAAARSLVAEPALARFFDPARYARAWNEVPVTTDGSGAVIDRLVDDGEVLWIVDYKTHAQPAALELAARYQPQLAAYAEAVARIWPGRPVRAGLVLTESRAWVPVIG